MSDPQNNHARRLLVDEVASLRAQLQAQFDRAEKAEQKLDAMEWAMVKVRAHTGHPPRSHRNVLAGLLSSIERIADAALLALQPLPPQLPDVVKDDRRPDNRPRPHDDPRG